MKLPLGFTIAIWSWYVISNVISSIYQTPRRTANLARWTLAHLHDLEGRTRQRLSHKSHVTRNVSVPACRLPEELLILIFDFVRSSGWFGEGLVDLVHRIDATSIIAQEQAPAYVGDLYACALVCRAWSSPATRVLWQYIPLRKPEDVKRFCSSSSPPLISCIRGVDIPFIIREEPRKPTPRVRQMLYDMWRPIPAALGYAKALPRDQSHHPPSIVTSISRVPVVEMLDAAAHENLRELRLIGSGPSMQLLTGMYRPAGLEIFNSLVKLHLQSVQNFRPYDLQITMPNLHCFSLEASMVTLPWLIGVLRTAQRLRALELRDVTIHSGTSGVLQRILDSVPHRLLERLVVCGIDVQHLLPGTGELRDMSDWIELKSLTVDGRLATSLPSPPPNLVHLTIVFRVKDRPRRDRRSAVLTDAADIKRTIERLQVNTPFLRVVNSWHSVRAGQEWQTWKAAAFLLHSFVSQVGIELNINLA